MLSREALKAFKKQYMEEFGWNLSDDEALAIALFENAILHTQNFIARFEQELGEMNSEEKARAVEDIMGYSLGLIFIYLGSNAKFDDIRSHILNEYRKFLGIHSGTTDEKQNETLSGFLHEKLHRNIMWLSTPFEKRVLTEKITSGLSSGIRSIPMLQYKPIVERLVAEVELSMTHFGVVK